MTNRNDVAGTFVAGMGMRFAEAVLPGHPDKLADQIADAIVDIALAHDDRAIVRYVALSQVAADLLTSPGRGPAEAESLLEWMRANETEWRA